MLRYRRPGFLAVATVGAALVTGCGGGTASSMDGGTGGASGSAGSSGGAGGRGGSTGGVSGGSGGNGNAGATGQGGQLDAGSDLQPASDGAADLRSDLPVVNPTITMLTPSSLPRNNGTFTLLIDGRDFPPGAEVTFETNVWTATVVSETQLSVQIPGAALGGTPRQVAVQVSGPTAPFVESNLLYFTITAPQ
jgi:hypothetical protein